MLVRVSLAVLIAWASLAPGVCAVACGDAPASVPNHAAAPADAMPCHGEPTPATPDEPSRPSECCDGEHVSQAFAKFSAPELGTAVAAIQLEAKPVTVASRTLPSVRPLQVLHSPYLHQSPPLLL